MINKLKGYPVNFTSIYTLIFMTYAIFSSFMPVYLHNIGYSEKLIGILLSIGSFVAFLSNPLWGVASDRAKYKNSVLKLLFLLNALSVVLFLFSKDFYYLLVVMIVFNFVQIGIGPLFDAMTLEHLEKTKFSFGPIRMMGTIGYALSAVIVGVISKWNASGMFVFYIIILLASFFITFKLPKIKGHMEKDKRVPVKVLLKNKKLVLIFAFNFVIDIVMYFFLTYFTIYYEKMGADNSLVGIAIFIGTISEIPFLIFADRIINKIGTRNILVISSVIISLRLFALFFVRNIYLILPLQILHGLTFIVFGYSLVTFIHKEMPDELKVTGQAIGALLGSLASIVAMLFGGFLSDSFGIRRIFFYLSLVNIVFMIGFIACYGLLDKSRKKGTAAVIE